MGNKPNKMGRNSKVHYTTFERAFLEMPAWRALSSTAKAIYPFLKLEWHGPNFNNNGKIRFSTRQAAAKVGMGVNTAARGFQDLQAKGYLVITQKGALGIEGEARGPSYELTEITMPGTGHNSGRRLYGQWREGNDFPIEKHYANNPKGRNGNKTPSPKQRQTYPQNSDVAQNPVSKLVTAYPQKGDVSPNSQGATVPKLKTSLITTHSRLSVVPDLSKFASHDLCLLTARNPTAH